MFKTKLLIFGFAFGLLGGLLDLSGSSDSLGLPLANAQPVASKRIPSNQQDPVPNNASEQTQTPESQSTFDRPTPELDARQRRELLEFVQANHPELEALVNSLKDKRPRQYESALRSLDKSVSSLRALQESGSQARYDQALETWKLNSRIQLLSAQLTIDDTTARRKNLKRLLTKQSNERYAQFAMEQERLQIRLKRYDELLSKPAAEREAEIQSRMDAIIKSSERIRAAREATQEPSRDLKERGTKKSDQKSKNQSTDEKPKI